MFRFVPSFIQIAVSRQYFGHHLGAGESNYIFRLSQDPFMFMPLMTLLVDCMGVIDHAILPDAERKLIFF